MAAKNKDNRGDDIELCNSGPEDAKQDLGDKNNTNRPQQEVADAVNNKDILSWRMLFAVKAVKAVFVLSLLVWLATLCLTITIWMSVKDRTEGACKVKGDFK